MENKAIIFDMDGLLIDSEPIWKEAGVELFTRLGYPMTKEKMSETMGMRCDEVVAMRYKERPWTELTLEKTMKELISLVVRKTKEHGKAMPGAIRAVQTAQNSVWKTAISSSSPMELIEAVLELLGVGGFDILHSAFSEKNGKPAPDVYFSTAKLLGVKPENCLAIEDSFNGVRSAKSAGMKCISVPDLRYTTKIDMQKIGADYILDSLENVSEELLTTIFNS